MKDSSAFSPWKVARWSWRTRFSSNSLNQPWGAVCHCVILPDARAFTVSGIDFLLPLCVPWWRLVKVLMNNFPYDSDHSHVTQHFSVAVASVNISGVWLRETWSTTRSLNRRQSAYSILWISAVYRKVFLYLNCLSQLKRSEANMIGEV